MAKKITAGDLRTRILLQTTVITKDAGGAQVISYTDIATVWCHWTSRESQETGNGETKKVIRMATAEIRKRSGIDEQISAVKDGQRYNVNAVADVDEMHEFIRLSMTGADGTV